MKQKLIALLLSGALCLSLMPGAALAARGDVEGGAGSSESGGREDGGSAGGHGGGHGGSEEKTLSGTELTIPEGIADGNYTGTATVNPDQEAEFDAYPIQVTLTMQGGVPVAFSVSGAEGKNANYTGKAQTKISSQINGLTAGVYTIDAVSGATCSKTAIVQALNAALQDGEAKSGTYYEMENTIVYDASGSTCLVTVHNPEEGANYEISLAYGVGKFSDDLEPRDSYCTVEQVSADADAQVYRVTMRPEVYYEIADDDLTHKLYVNNPGTSLSVKVNGSSAGTFTIVSEAVPSITDNTLALTGGRGDTQALYLSLLDEVTVSYTDANGETVSTRYTTAWQHDMEPAFTGSDLFGSDGSINFDLKAVVTLTGEDFEALKDENGNNVTQEVTVFPLGSAGTYTITLSAGDGYPNVTAVIGGVEPDQPEQPAQPDTPSEPDTPAETEAPADAATSDANQTASGTQTKNADRTNAATVQTAAPKTADSAPAPVILLTAAVLALGAFLLLKKQGKIEK